MYTLLSRKEAFDQGLKRFYTGRPCVNGHDAQRFVSTGGCVKCNAERASKFRDETVAMQTARQQRLFTYRLHPDDHAALLAYAQGLDMARGRVPQAPSATPAYHEPTREEIIAMRTQIFGKVVDVLPSKPEPVDPSDAWMRDAWSAPKS